MSATAAAAAASAAAAAANSAATMAMVAAQRAECRVVVDRFTADGATVAAMQLYAQCVDLLYPRDADMLWLKVIVVFAIASFLGGCAYGWMHADRDDRWLDACGYGFVWAIGAMVLAGIVGGLVWVVS